MAKSYSEKTKKPYGKTLSYGVLSLALYAVVLTNEAYVREVWGKGGVYAILPIATVFLFSFIHGSFANNLMTSLGIEAKKK
ncbi:MAG: hypothetical protein HY779_03865 [Rubrobacteridae bacterium]|nr:hypothetical protein [Rubrobacteridae bacterium]